MGFEDLMAMDLSYAASIGLGNPAHFDRGAPRASPLAPRPSPPRPSPLAPHPSPLTPHPSSSSSHRPQAAGGAGRAGEQPPRRPPAGRSAGRSAAESPPRRGSPSPGHTHTPSTSSTHHPTHPTHPPQPKTHTPHLSYPIPLTTPTIFTPKIHLFTDRPPTDHPKHHFVLTQMLTISNPNFDHIHTYYIPPDGWAPHTRPVCGFPHLLQYMPHTLKIRTYVYADIARHLSRDREKCRPLALLRFALGVGTANRHDVEWFLRPHYKRAGSRTRAHRAGSRTRYRCTSERHTQQSVSSMMYVHTVCKRAVVRVILRVSAHLRARRQWAVVDRPQTGPNLGPIPSPVGGRRPSADGPEPRARLR